MSVVGAVVSVRALLIPRCHPGASTEPKEMPMDYSTAIVAHRTFEIVLSRRGGFHWEIEILYSSKLASKHAW